MKNSDFGFMEDCWDLQAVVSGSSCSSDVAFADINNNHHHHHHPSTTIASSAFAPAFSFDDQNCYDDLSIAFPEIFGSMNSDFNDEQLFNYKPFFPVLHQQPPPDVSKTSETRKVVQEQQQPPPPRPVLSVSVATSASSVVSDSNLVTKPRRRKNQQNRVVHQVKEDELSSDKWAWRKYGQKPIKGSPYPRSYYRCSSLKGCLARKQVERSSTDPSIYIITYTAEHSHAHPTRRNSLAGTTRTRSSIPKEVTSYKDQAPTIKQEECNSSSMASDESLGQHGSIKNEEEEQNSSVEIAMPDIVFSDDLFPSLEDFEGVFLDQFANSTVQ